MRPPVRVVAVAAPIAALILLGNTLSFYRSGKAAEIVAVSVTPSGKAPVGVRLYAATKIGWGESDAVPDNRWTLGGVWIGEILLSVPPDEWHRVGGVAVSVGGRAVELTPIEARRCEVSASAIELPTAFNLAGGYGILLRLTPALGPPPPTRLRAFAGVINWPGDGRAALLLLRSTLPHVALVLAGTALVMHLRRTPARAWAERWLTPAPAGMGRPSGGRHWDAVGAAVLVGGLIALEVRQPRYFTKDDVAVAELPILVFGARSVWDGRIPEYNPLLYLGTAHASTGMMQVTYPPMYVAYAIARHGFGDECLLAEVSAVLHLLAGYAVCRILAGRVGLAPLPAVLVALSFVLSGPILIVGRSWHSFLLTVVWLPALLLGMVALAAGPVGWRWVVGMGLAVGGFFHVGFTQNPAFSCGFVLVGVAYLCAAGRLPVRRAALLGPAFLIGAGIAAPLLYQQAVQMAGVSRGYNSAPHCGEMLPAAVLPYPLVRDRNLSGWIQIDPERAGHAAFFGGVFAWLALIEAAALALAPPPRAEWAGRVWLSLCGLAVLLGLGEAGLLWQIGGTMPVVDSMFRLPFRLLPFIAMFGCLAGGVVLDRLLRRAGSDRRWEAAAGAIGFGLLGYHLYAATSSFNSYPVPPYPPLPPVMEPLIADGTAGRSRFLSVGYKQSDEPWYAYGLPMDLNVVYGLPGFDGYIPISENATFLAAQRRLQADPLAAARAYGIGWVTMTARPTAANTQLTLPWRQYVVNGRVGMMLEPHLELVGEMEGLRLYRLPGADPLAFAAGRPNAALPLGYGTSGVDLDVSGVSAGDTVTANFLWYPAIRAYLDGRPVPAAADDWGRIRVALDRTGDSLQIRYEPRWVVGLAAGAVLIAAGVIAAGVLLRVAPLNTACPSPVGP